MTDKKCVICETVRAHCNKCLGEKNHRVLFTDSNEWSEEINHGCEIHGSEVYEMLKCCGCDSIVLRHKSYFSEDYDDEGRPISRIYYYPPTFSRRKPSWYFEIIAFDCPFSSIKELLDEVYVAIQNGSLHLATMGIRAIIEKMMIDKVNDHGTFKANLDEMQNQGYVSLRQRETLEVILDAGHATTHRDYCPTSKDLTKILDICESIIETLYVHDIQAKSLKEKIPPRQGRSERKKAK